MHKVRVFFLTYAWLIAIVFIVLLLLSTSHVLEPKSICQLDDLSCSDVILTRTGLTLEFHNPTNAPASLSAIKIAGDYIDCSPVSVTVPAGSSQQASLTCTRQQALSYQASISLNYNNKQISGKLIVK